MRSAGVFERTQGAAAVIVSIAVGVIDTRRGAAQRGAVRCGFV